MMRLFIVLFFLILPLSMIGQEPEVIVEKSSEKILIDGQVYYIHTVREKETIYSICKTYGISPKTLSRENPGIIIGLQPGQVLKIPEVVEEEALSPQTGDFIYHQMREGETVYSISRQHHVTVEEILEANPDLVLDDLPVETVLKIPRMEFYPEKQSFTVQDKEYYLYRVGIGETFNSIARKFSLNTRDLRRMNREKGRFLDEGDYIRVPGTEKTHAYFERGEEEPEAEEAAVDNYCNIQVPDYFTGRLDVALLLPFYLDKNAERTYIDSSERNERGDTIFKLIKREDDWIYPWSYRFIEFYEGVLIAIDSLRKRGLNVSLSVFDTKRDPIRVREIAESGALDDMDLIIGPVYSMNIEILTKTLGRTDIPVISPFVQNGALLERQANLFEVVPDHFAENELMAKVVSREYRNNIVVVHPGDSLETDNFELFKWTLLDSLGQYADMENIVLKEVVFSEARPRHDTINEIGQALLEDGLNVIVVYSGKETFVSEVLAKLFNLAKNYELKVYGFPEWQRFRNIELGYFHSIDVYICSPFMLDYSDKDVKSFLSKYRGKYNTEPVPHSFAWNGYDISYFFLSGLATYKDRFLECYTSFNTNLLVSDFQFEKISYNSGAMNRKLHLLHFTDDLRIEIVPLPEIPIPDFDIWFNW